MPIGEPAAFAQGLDCRTILPVDVPELIALDRAVMAPLGLDRPIDHPRRADLRDAARTYAPPGAMLVVLAGERPVAMGGFLPEPDAVPTARLKRVRVAAAWRRRGIARRLVDRLERLAADAGYRVMRLHVTGRQGAALALYGETGYRITDRYDGDFGPEYLLEKPIAE